MYFLIDVTSKSIYMNRIICNDVRKYKSAVARILVKIENLIPRK